MERDRTIFKKSVIEQFKVYCKREKVEPTAAELLEYIIQSEIIDDAKIRKYAIISVFEEQLPVYKYHKTNTVYHLAEKFNISDRQVWNILKHHLYVRKRKNVPLL